MSDQILIIEDDDVVAYGLEAMLTSAGYGVRRKKIDASLVAGPPPAADMVVMDFLMPSDSRIPPGIATLLMEFKASSKERGVPVLDISSRLESSRKQIEEGEPFLKKSFSKEELLQLVGDALAKVKASKAKGEISSEGSSAPGTDISGVEDPKGVFQSMTRKQWYVMTGTIFVAHTVIWWAGYHSPAFARWGKDFWVLFTLPAFYVFYRYMRELLGI